jgi:hypothetical protein
MTKWLLSVVPIALAAASCSGSTGYQLVLFYAAAEGPADAQKGQPYAFTSDKGYAVSLTKATMHVGAIYLDQSRPTSGAAEQACTLPGTYVGEVRGGLDVDMLSPDLQFFGVAGDGSTIPSLIGQVWLSGSDIFDASDATVVLSVSGTATSPDGTTMFPFTGDITIDSHRFSSSVGSAMPGANPICIHRIVTPIDASLTLGEGGTLVLRLDPAPLFVGVEFADLTKFSKDPDPPAYGFTNGSDGPSNTLYSNLTNPGSVYRFEWRNP